MIALLAMLVLFEFFDRFGPKIGVTPSWEYRLESPSDLRFEEEINKFGEEGWELVFARRATSSYGGGASYEIILKRPSSK